MQNNLTLCFTKSLLEKLCDRLTVHGGQVENGVALLVFVIVSLSPGSDGGGDGGGGLSVTLSDSLQLVLLLDGVTVRGSL